MRYGIDAPYVPAILGVVAVVCLVAGFAVSGAGWLVVVGAVFAVQVLIFMRPDGHLVIADIRSVRQYGAHLRACGAAQVKVRNLGVGFWYAGSWQATSAVTATKS